MANSKYTICLCLLFAFINICFGATLYGTYVGEGYAQHVYSIDSVTGDLKRVSSLLPESSDLLIGPSSYDAITNVYAATSNMELETAFFLLDDKDAVPNYIYMNFTAGQHGICGIAFIPGENLSYILVGDGFDGVGYLVEVDLTNNFNITYYATIIPPKGYKFSPALQCPMTIDADNMILYAYAFNSKFNSSEEYIVSFDITSKDIIDLIPTSFQFPDSIQYYENNIYLTNTINYASINVDTKETTEIMRTKEGEGMVNNNAFDLPNMMAYYNGMNNNEVPTIYSVNLQTKEISTASNSMNYLNTLAFGHS